MVKRQFPKPTNSTEEYLLGIVEAIEAGRVASRHQSITPSDVTEYSNIKALYVGTAGTLVLEDSEGLETTYLNVVGVFPFSPTKIKAASTAVNIIAWYF